MEEWVKGRERWGGRVGEGGKNKYEGRGCCKGETPSACLFTTTSDHKHWSACSQALVNLFTTTSGHKH